MGIKTILKQRLAEEAAMQDVKAGRLPARSYDIQVPSVKAPRIKAGEVAYSDDWERAIMDLNLWLSAIEDSIKNIKQGIPSNELHKAELLLSSIESQNRARLERGSANENQYIYTFSHLPLTFERGIDNLPETTCEIDFYKQCAMLRQKNDWCSRVTLDNAKIYWYVEPDDCKTQQLGSIEGLLDENGNGWILSVSGRSNIVLHIEIETENGVALNFISLGINGSYSKIQVYVNNKEVPCIDREQKWYMFPETEVKKIHIAISKNGYDDDSTMSSYFSLRGIETCLKRFEQSGIYVSPPLDIECAELAVKPYASLPAGTSIETYIGFQNGQHIEWRFAEPGRWLKTPGLSDKISETFSLALNGGNGLYKLCEFADEPLISTIELYPACNMWIVEKKQAHDGTACTLQDWHTITEPAYSEYIKSDSSMVLKAGYIYRFYAFIKCDERDSGIINKWRPHPETVNHRIYINWIEQNPTGGYYDIQLNKGWNLVELIVLPNSDTVFAPLLSVNEAASLMCGTPGSAEIKPLKTFLQEDEANLKSAGYSNGSLYVKHNKGAIGNIQYLCRYYTNRGTKVKVRVMVIMKSSASDYSPVLTGCALRWR